MAQLSGHLVAPPPRAPERERTGRLLLRAFAALLVFSVFAAPWGETLLGPVGAPIVHGVLTAGALAVWIPLIARSRGDKAFPWSSLPWVALGYVALALASIAWSPEPGATAHAAGMLAALTAKGLFLAFSLSWTELMRTLEIALRWLLAVALVSVVVRKFFEVPVLDALAPEPLGVAAVAALAVFSVSLQLARTDRRPAEAIVSRVVWLGLAAWALVVSGTAPAFVAAATAAVTGAIALIMRRQTTPQGRTRVYLGFGAATIVAGAASAGPLLSGVRAILADGAHTVLPTTHAGTVLLGVATAAAIWRAWFFAVDRPRWDARKDRAFSPLSMAPLLLLWAITALFLTAPEEPMQWTWLLLIAFAFKIGAAPILTHPEHETPVARRHRLRLSPPPAATP